MSALGLDEGTPDSETCYERAAGKKARKRGFGFSLFALPKAPRRRKGGGGGGGGASSSSPYPPWDAPTPGSSRALPTEFAICKFTGAQRAVSTYWELSDTRALFRAGGALGDAEVGDELWRARRARERELFLWVRKRKERRTELG